MNNKMIEMSDKKFELPKLPEFPLPPKAFGLATGQAGERRGGTPRTEAERRARHPALPQLPFMKAGSNPETPNFEDLLPALPPELPLPRFLVRQMRKK